MRFSDMLRLADHGPDTFVASGPRYPWGGLYGGQIVAQALRAAAATVGSGFVVHSLHAYFIRLGDASEPIRLEVDRLRNGRSFVMVDESKEAIAVMEKRLGIKAKKIRKAKKVAS